MFTPTHDSNAKQNYPAHWWAPVTDQNVPSWEVLPQAARTGEVVLSKRNELGILSNFAATEFTLHQKKYASIEGFWQMMLYPESPDDLRLKNTSVIWPYQRSEVMQMTAFKAKSAGEAAEKNMQVLGIDWVTYQGKKIKYRSPKKGEHYELIRSAMLAKLNQNPKVKQILLSTGDLKLIPDHHQEENAPPEWKYNEIWMELRDSIK